MNKILFRASGLGDIMTDPKGKGEVLSAGAKTTIIKMAKEFVYGFDERISSKYMTKGIQVEDESIELLNMVLGTSYVKNQERKTNEWLTGEADIVGDNRIIDIKSSWSMGTFPAIAEQGEDTKYEWQGRAYMMLWDVPEFSIAYCLVNTPPELIGYEEKSMHIVDHIIPELRVTLVHYKRDKALEEKIMRKVEAAREYYEQVVRLITDQHSFRME
jgi:hypothetical protein